MNYSQPCNFLRRLLCGITENTFHTQLGVADPLIVDYLGNLLLRFVRQESVEKIRDVKGQKLRAVSDMLAEAEARVGEARREVHRHIGDYTLFWAGLYPESLRRQRSGVESDQFLDYCVHGKRAYRIAATIETNRETEAPSHVLSRLSEHFEMCAYGLREVRRELERRDDLDDSQPFLIN